MKWSAIIERKEAVDASGAMAYSVGICADGEVVMAGVEIRDVPATIQQAVAARVTAFASSYELASGLPSVGDEIVVIEASETTASATEMSYNVPEEPKE